MVVIYSERNFIKMQFLFGLKKFITEDFKKGNLFNFNLF